MIEYESNTENSWYGNINKYGKADDFVIEHVIFDGHNIVGYFSLGDSLCTFKGAFLDNAQSVEAASRGKGMMFRLEATCAAKGVRYEIRGYFDKMEMKCSIRDLPPRSSPVILSLDMKSQPCTVFIEPGKWLLQGQIRVTNDRVTVLFMDKGQLNIISGYLNKEDIYVAYLTRGPKEKDVFSLVQTYNPIRVRNKRDVFCFSEINQSFGLIIEMAKELSFFDKV